MSVQTDPTGRVFVLYQRTRPDEMARLVQALRIHGVLTWQHVRDLGPHSAPAQVRQVLADPATAGAVVWISPDLATSAFIREIEVPAVVERATRQDGFFAQLVAAGGLAQAEAGEIASRGLGLSDLTYWNVLRVTADPLDEAGDGQVARAVLHAGWRRSTSDWPQESH